ncbi:MAG: GTP-binding protein [Verrucomicrobiales bacterium]|jgi:GTP-binding protein
MTEPISPTNSEAASHLGEAASHLVAIVGRPNVGKSAIFNRLAGRRIAIVHDQPGVTRDRITAPAKTSGELPFSIIDTGGIGAALDDGFTEQVAAEVDIAITMADLILFVVDGKEGITHIDEILAKQLRKAAHPVILLVNKVDHDKHDGKEMEFTSLGFEHLQATSAEHGRGFDELERRIDGVLATLPPATHLFVRPSKDPIKVAIVGRPNVGKSSLINAILGENRTIVSDVAGTTRDAVDVPFELGGKDYNLIDTAGIRQRTKRDSSVEVFSVMRSERSIRRADICALVVDSANGVTAQDRRIARTIMEEKKPCVILSNKYDLYHPDGRRQERLEQLTEEIRRELFFLDYAPLVALSALKGQHVNRLFHVIQQVQEAAARPVSTGTLNRLLEQALAKNPPPMRKMRRLKILYASALKSDSPGPIPVPHYVFFINNSSLMSDDYARYLENQLRKENSYEGLPIKIQLRARPPRKDRKLGSN